MTLILVVVLLFLLIGSFPRWPYNQQWGYGPSSLVGILLIVLLILLLTGRLHV